MNSQTLRVSVVLQAILVALAMSPRGAEADALDHWTRSQVSTNPIGWMGIMLRSVAYGQDRYVAVGTYTGSDTGMIQTSEDGITWTMRSPQDDSILELRDVAFGNGIFVAVGWDFYTGKNLYHSTNGLNWSSHTNAHVSNFYGLTYGNGLFVAVGDGVRPNTGYLYTNRNIYTSPDGITWTGRSSGAPAAEVHPIKDVAYGAGRFVAVDDAGYTYTSSSGTTWTRSTAGLRDYVNYCNGLFISLGTSGTNFVSADGLSWSKMTKDVPNDFTQAIYAHGLYAALSGTQLFTSSNGTNWVQRDVQPPADIAWGGLSIGSSNLVLVGWTQPGGLTPYIPQAAVSGSLLPALVIAPGLPVRLTLSGVSGCPYSIQYRPTLAAAPISWQSLTSLSLGSGPFVCTDTNCTNTRRFYRAALLP